jgi:hypothetical protein
VAVAFAITETAAIGFYPPLLVSRLCGFSAARHLAQSYLAGAAAFALSFGVASLLFAAGEGPVALALRLALWGAIVLPLGLVLILPRAQMRRLLPI